MISLVPSTSSPTAGESVSLTCSVTLTGTVSDSSIFWWAGPGDTPTAAAPSTSGHNVTSTLTLSAVRTSEAGQYTCIFLLEDPNQTVSIALRSVNITVQSKCIPAGEHILLFSVAPPSPPQFPGLVWPSPPAALLLCMLALASPSPVLSHWTPGWTQL